MALKKDRSQVKIEAPSGNVPYVPAKSYLSIGVDAFKPTLDRLQREADQTAQANYFQDFQIKTRDQFEKFRNDFSMDPDKMKAAADTYSKTLLDSVPAAYKIQANAMLSAYSQNSIIFASGNKRKFDDNKLFADRDTKWKNWNSEAEFSMRNFNEAEIDLAIPAINKEFLNSVLQINELAHEDYENLVALGKIKEKDHIANINTQSEALVVSRGFHIMKTLYNNGQEAQALNWLNDFMNDKDQYDAMIDSDMENNPMYKVIRTLYEDDDDRMRIGNDILKKYKAFHRDAIFGRTKKPDIDFDMLKEPGNILAIENFKGGDVSMNEILDQIPVDIGSKKYTELVKYVADANRIQSIVSKTMQNPEIIYNFESDEDREMWAKAVLANNGINKVQYSSLNSDSFKIAMNIFAGQDYFPDEVRKYLTLNDAGSFKDEGSLTNLMEKSLMYQYLSNEELFPNVEYNHLFQKALDSGAVNSIANGDFNRASSILESFQSENYDKKLANITAQYDGNNASFEYMFNAQLKSPNAFLKFFQDKKDPLHDNLFAAGDQTTWLAWEPKEIIPPNAMAQLKGMWIEEMTAMTTGENPDIWSKENSHLRSKAFNRVMKRMEDEGWGVETNTMDGKAKLVKNPFWKTYGTLDNNDVYAAIKEDFTLLNNNEKLSKYGTNKWEEVEGYFRQYADNKDGLVKISVDRQNYKDKSGKHAYKLTMHIGDDMITLDKNFTPAAWTNLVDKDVPSSNAQLINHTTNQIFEDFKKTSWYDKLPEDKQHWTKRAIYSVIRNGIKLSDYRFYPDIPGIDDVPAEVRPFAWIAKTLGFDGDLREIRTELQMAATTANENLSYQKKINNNRNLSDTEKVTESLLPPEKTVMTENAMSLNFKQWALDNYENQELRLTHRTNNWTAVSSSGWDGEIDLKYKRDSRNFAVFAHPKDSIRAAVKSILNHSTLTNAINNVDKRYGSTPTYDEIFKMYAEDNESYLRALESKTNFDRNDTVDIMNNNQLHSLLKFIVQHEMGREYYFEKFGKQNQYVNSVIFKGINEAINSYNGELGKL